MEKNQQNIVLESNLGFNSENSSSYTLPNLPATEQVPNNKYASVCSKLNIPTSVCHILPLQLAEQYCNTSIRGMLNLYLQVSSGITQEHARSQVHLIGALIYSAPAIGGMVADLAVGAFYASVLFSVVFLLGMASLTFFSIDGISGYQYPTIPLNLTMLSLLTISVGLGAMKPCLTALSSHQIEMTCKTDETKTKQGVMLDRYFRGAFLVSNFGILSASFITPTLAGISCGTTSHCYPLGFGVASAVLMLMAVIFYSGWPKYIKGYTARYNSSSASKLTWGELVKDESVRRDFKRLGKFLIMCFPLSFFWMMYDQSSTSWQSQYEQLDHKWLGFSVRTELMGNVGGILLLIFIPLLTKFVDPFLKSRKMELVGIPRMIVAFIFLLAAFTTSTLLQYRINDSIISNTALPVVSGGRTISCEGCLSGAWQLPQWCLQSMAEALLGTATPHFAHCQGGDRFRVLGPGLLFLTNSFGNVLVFTLDHYVFEGMAYIPRMWCYIAICGSGTILFSLLYIMWYRHVLEAQEASEPTEKLTSSHQ